MAGKKLITFRLQSSTILEVIISMVIIVIVFGIVMMIYTNVLNSSLSVKKIHALNILNEQAIIAERDCDLKEFDINTDSLRIVKKVINYGQNSALDEIWFTAYDDNQNVIADLKKVIYVPQ